MTERRKLQKDDLPRELWPMWDELQRVAEEIEAAHRSWHRAKVASWVMVGALAAVAICNIVPVILRGL